MDWQEIYEMEETTSTFLKKNFSILCLEEMDFDQDVERAINNNIG